MNSFIRRSQLLAMLMCLPVLAIAATTIAEQDALDGETLATWEESAVTLPAPPKKENLLSFYVSPTSTIEFTVDAKSLSVDKDGVVRYTLVATSRSGATNVSYEGIRCQSAEKKLYAFGQTDGSWSRARRDTWDVIRESGANRQHATLALEYFCDGHSVAGKAETIVERLRRKKPLR
jgi:hypothetical protein